MCAGTTRRHERARSAFDYNVLDESPDSPIGYARRHPDFSSSFIEFGAAIVGLALLAAGEPMGFFDDPTLSGGLAFGPGGVAPLDRSEDIIHTGGEIGVLLLLFMLGLQRFRQ